MFKVWLLYNCISAPQSLWHSYIEEIFETVPLLFNHTEYGRVYNSSTANTIFFLYVKMFPVYLLKKLNFH